MDSGCGSEKLSKDEVLSRFSERSVLEGRSLIPFSRNEVFHRAKPVPNSRRAKPDLGAERSKDAVRL